MQNSFVIRGNICQTMNPKELDLHEHAYAVCVNGVSKGVFDSLPKEYAFLPLYDYGDALIFPGMVDLHVHAPQYAFRGMCMDLELMDWLNRYTFPEEEKYENLEYAEKAYSIASISWNSDEVVVVLRASEMKDKEVSIAYNKS